MQITAVQRTPQMPQSQEPTKDQPVTSQVNEQGQGGEAEQTDEQQQWLDQYGKKLLDLIQKTRQSWEWKRRAIVQEVLKGKEFLKGNQAFGFFPGTFDTYDALEQYYNFTGSGTDKNGDQSMDIRPHNFYQMCENAFEAALSSQVPKNRYLPADPDRPEDRETAKAGSKAETVIERANDVANLLKLELQELWTGGCYFKFTRYVVDSERTGTHKETVLQMVATDVLPARFVCYNCGTSTPEDEIVKQQKLVCPNCGAPLSDENYFESHADQIPVGEVRDDVPNGMVLQDVYGALNIDADPDAMDLRGTRLLNCGMEVALGWLRTTFEKMWDRFDVGQGDSTGTGLMERQMRDLITSPTGYGNQFTASQQQKPTYNRTWLTPELFAELDSKDDAKALQKQFPKGLMLAWVGELPLQIRPAKLTEEWTHCPAKKGFGLYAPPVGKPAIPIQERINDCVNKIDEYFDRLACGILLANEQYLDTKAMNNKRMYPGLLNPVAFKRNAPLSQISELIFQVKTEIDRAIFSYVSTLKQDMELLVGTPPQTFGAGTQQGVDTFGGQQLQHDTGMMKLGLTWQMMRKEHAESGENAVMCAARNMTDDWKMAVLNESKEFQSEYVHIDEMKGSVHAEPETDQGFPMMWSEIRDFYMTVLEKGGELLDFLASEPENVDNMLRYIAVPGLIAPGANKRNRLLFIVNKLVMSQPVPGADPVTGAPMVLPSILPIKELDGNQATQHMLINWTEAHWDKVADNKAALDNILAYYRMCVQFERELAAEQALTAPGAAPGLPPGGPQGQTPPAMA